MSLAPGTRLGAYEIVSPLGAGGMGEVYRARDTKLGREVAIKVLPESVAADSERIARLEREAQVLASLNHPNIAHIHGLEDSTGVPALVMELVEGQTLAERIAHRPIQTEEALRLAHQIAEALDAAHERGIVHRDLKPANIKIAPDGMVKVLDFGLAKVLDETPPDLTQSPTIAVHGTRTGVLLGTAGYMSPEQARGQPVDRRADIWAFGCVLYELLTGQHAFLRDTLTDTLAAIVEREPDWVALPPTTPAPTVQLLHRCLDKRLKHRLRDIGDAFPGLEPTPAIEQPPVYSRRGLRWLAFAVPVIGIGIVGAIWITIADRPSRVTLGSLVKLTHDSGYTTRPSISADGRLIAYASDRSGDGNLDIWVQQTAGGPPIRLTTDPTDDTDPDVSPDGATVAFRSDRNGGGIYLVPALGGDARLVAAEGRAPKFSPDGRSVAFWTGGWLAPHALNAVRHAFIVPIAGGEPTPVAKTLATVGDPVWSPDGRALLVFGQSTLSGSDPHTDWWWVPLDGRPPIQSGAFERLRAAGIATGPNAAPNPGTWTERGVVFAAIRRNSDAQNLWIVPIDGRTGHATAAPRPITSGPSVDGTPAAARDGRIVFASESMRNVILGVPLDANAARTIGTARRLRDDLAVTARASASLDGGLLVFPVLSYNGGEIWMKDLRSGRERELAVTARGSLIPVISADGKWVGYTATTAEMGAAGGPGDAYIVEAAGGAPRKVCAVCEMLGWLADDRRVIVRSGRAAQIDVVDFERGSRETALRGDTAINRPLVAWNEHWIAFNTSRRIFLAPFTPGQPPPKSAWVDLLGIVPDGDRACGWSPDGRLLYVLLQRDGFRCLYAIRIDDASGRPVGDPFPVYHFHKASLQWGSTGYGSAVVNGLFVADLFEYGGNVWMSDISF